MAAATSAIKVGPGEVQYSFSDGSVIIWSGYNSPQADNNLANQVVGSFTDIGEYVDGTHTWSIFQGRAIGVQDLESYLLSVSSKRRMGERSATHY